ncbi:MAG: imidazolonepropionase [Planctomycetes bacterium]|nr:imidazolonepropionase [Planctomycetota bacterium]
MSVQVDLLLKEIGQLVTLAPPAGTPQGAPWRGPLSELATISDAALAVHEGRIVDLGPAAEVAARVQATREVSAGGGLVLPGFVDPHTHLPWLGSREAEFELRLAGKSYAEIAKAGGGIRSTTRSVRGASVDQLTEAALPRLDRMLSCGTTTAEAKSGYGLALAAERTQLEAIRALDSRHAIDLVATNLAAHEIPDEHRADRGRWLDLLCEELLPDLAGLAEFCDVFCEDHVFTVPESRRILSRAKELGYGLKIHADEIVPTGGAELAVELGAVSADHLACTGQAGIAALAASETVAVLLPGTSFYLRKSDHAPGRAMIDAGVAVALATDLNPGSSLTESLPMILTLACLQCGLTPAEALRAATLNAACAIGRGAEIGSLEVGKQADFVVWDAPNWRYLPTHFGVSLVRAVYKRGALVFNAEAAA